MNVLWALLSDQVTSTWGNAVEVRAKLRDGLMQPRAGERAVDVEQWGTGPAAQAAMDAASAFTVDLG